MGNKSRESGSSRKQKRKSPVVVERRSSRINKSSFGTDDKTKFLEDVKTRSLAVNAKRRVAGVSQKKSEYKRDFGNKRPFDLLNIHDRFERSCKRHNQEGGTLLGHLCGRGVSHSGTSSRERLGNMRHVQMEGDIDDTTACETSEFEDSVVSLEEENGNMQYAAFNDNFLMPFVKTRAQKLKYMKEGKQKFFLNSLNTKRGISRRYSGKGNADFRGFQVSRRTSTGKRMKNFKTSLKNVRRNRYSVENFVTDCVEKRDVISDKCDQGEDIESELEIKGKKDGSGKEGEILYEGDENRAKIEDGSEGILKSDIPRNVVKVYCTHCWPSFSYPWTTAGQTYSSSTGIVWSAGPNERLLLTNAHSVQYAAVVHVRKRGDHQKFEAKVLCIGYDCDLALLGVDDDDFWESMNPLVWGNTPQLEDPVTVVGYPVGGDNASVTQGVVSRIDFQRYTVGSCNLLAIQIDAAINGGNSGGPALNKNKECVGIAFQSLKDSDTENIGYIIPSEVVFHFMEDFKLNGKYTGFGSCSFIWQKVENKQMQQYFGIQDKSQGVLISKVDKTSPAVGLLKKGDIVLSVNGHEVAADGTVPFSNGERIAFEWLLCQKFVGQSSFFSILRSKRHKEIELPVVRSEPLVPTYLPNEKKPEYYIAGGLVFIPLSELFLTSEYGQDCMCQAPGHLIAISNRYHKEFEDEQIVVIGHVLAHEITIGYEDFAHHCVREFNGQKINNLRHLIHLVETCIDEFWRFDLDSEMVIILNADAAKVSLRDILKQNMIPSTKSAGL